VFMQSERSDSEFEQAINDYLDVAVELERAAYKSDIEPFEAYAAKLRERLGDSLRQFQRTYSHGYRLLIDELKKKKSEQELKSYEAELSNLTLFDDAGECLDFFREGKTLRELLGFTEQTMLDFYEAASNLLEEHRYKDALDAFFFLVTIAPNV